MSTQVIVWILVIGLFAAIILVRFTAELLKHVHHIHSHGMPIFNAGPEREEFFVPGDIIDDEEDLLYDED